jgi:hypothetical protein
VRAQKSALAARRRLARQIKRWRLKMHTRGWITSRVRRAGVGEYIYAAIFPRLLWKFWQRSRFIVCEPPGGMKIGYGMHK